VNVLLSQIELKGVIQESGGKIEKAWVDSRFNI
jgi:hypothetical protein